MDKLQIVDDRLVDDNKHVKKLEQQILVMTNHYEEY